METYEDLKRRKEELEVRLGPHIHPDGFIEFAQRVDKAFSLRNTNPTEAELLRKKAAEMLPLISRAVERAVWIRDQIKVRMIEHANKAMDEYHEALKELSK